MFNSEYKVIVRLKATGNAPILKQQVYIKLIKVFKLSSGNKFGKLVTFIRKELGLNQEQLYCYVNSAFMPGLDDILGIWQANLGDLDKLFGLDSQGLIVNYSLSPAWG